MSQLDYLHLRRHDAIMNAEKKQYAHNYRRCREEVMIDKRLCQRDRRRFRIGEPLVRAKQRCEDANCKHDAPDASVRLQLRHHFGHSSFERFQI